jgi:hypothetical protein
MTATDGRGAARYIVRVVDVVHERTAGHPGCDYTSPAQSRREALTLARLLVGEDLASPGGDGIWTRTVAIPGGRRTATLTRIDRSD